ncbi:oxygen-dependent tRNA uridine(34) hydroxylase TrhO [Salinithrix halophila]|uniref:tRNA uridine(34) hydroxylase n=1 Tax=Salinithrix halophila TaxID=1485204 RepID=A0ABV8JBU6_9BACL
MESTDGYQVLLYYKYVRIDDPKDFAKRHLAFCQELGLKGRILVAEEGINGTVSGTIAATEVYMEAMHQDPRFREMVFKVDPHEGHAFKKMHVRPKEELVTFRVDRELDPNQKSGKRLSPKEFHEAMQDEEVLILDGRNDYEYDLGRFKNAIRPNVRSFREFPDWIRDHLADYKDKKILTYCTGGIRCEKLTAYMLEEGFRDVAQLEGGIVTYGKDPEVKGLDFEGKCFVFDERLSVSVNRVEEMTVGRCLHCGEPSERYINCRNDPCHRLYLCCSGCEEEHGGFCGSSCEKEAKTV